MDNNKNEINKTDLINNQFLKLKSLHDYFINKNNENNFNENHNIYIKYLNNHNIIFQNNDINNENFKSIINELYSDIEKGNHIIFPFLDNLCLNLLKAYIESNLDDKDLYLEDQNNKTSQISDSVYLKIFSKLKNNCFIEKEILFPIYGYFSELYDIATKQGLDKENSFNYKKLNKVIKLFEIFYDISIDDKNISTFSFIGGSIDIIFNNAFQFLASKDFQIDIKLNVSNRDYIKFLNDEFYLLKINDEEVKYKEFKDNIGEGGLNSIKININEKMIFFEFETKKVFNITKNVALNDIKCISLFQEFYGQISSIELSIGNSKNKIEYEFLPLSIRNEKEIYYFKKIINNNNDDGENKLNNISNIIPKIIVNNKNLVNINYINYNDKKFDIIDYFGGIIQFLPFYKIFKSFKEKRDNSNEAKIQSPFTKNIDREILNNFFNLIMKIIIRKLFSVKKKKKRFKKSICFAYYLLLDLNLDLNLDLSCYEKDKSLYYYLDLLLMIYYNQKNNYSTNIKNEIEDFINKWEHKEDTDLSFFKKPNHDLNQIYKQYMKKLFSFNNLWSKKDIFFPKKYNNKNSNELLISNQIKYKQLNYYTKNFQLPFFYPIFEYKKYYPNFKKYKGKLYKDNQKQILEYDFELEINEKADIIIDILFSKSKKNNTTIISEKCCHVKNTHHVKGELSFIQKNKKNKNFKIIFTSKNETENCNKNINKKISRTASNVGKALMNNKLCYGSTFPCPNKEYNRKIIIKSKEIIFVLIRIYYHKVSAIEIFTLNKSYYFNFNNLFEINYIKTNKILNEIKNNPFFKEMKIKKGKLIIGYYNIKYKPYFFPLFEDEINFWDKKINYFCNYDILTLVNLFSNRSFRDVFQYPVFPILYDVINEKREMDEHIGFQNITPKSIERKNLFLTSYITYREDNKFGEEICLFNIHYSNPSFVFNYLLRVFPYSFLAIEFQGKDFDNPNRLFYSVESELINTLEDKTDLREMIPELFYMIELFYNKNNIFFEKPSDGKNIDNVEIKKNDNICKDMSDNLHHDRKMEIFSKFLCTMRTSLEKNKKINKWIDLIFGINQKSYNLDEQESYQYYEKCSEIAFKNDPKVFEDKLTMEKVNFGLLPYQLFNQKFPPPNKDKKTKEKKLSEINILNKELFNDEHITIDSPIQTFICKGRILLDDNYVKIIEPKDEIYKLENYFNFPYNIAQKVDIISLNKYIKEYVFNFNFNIKDNEQKESDYKDSMSLVNYYFIGDVYGSISIFVMKKIKKEEKSIDKEEEDDLQIEEKKSANPIGKIGFIINNFGSKPKLENEKSIKEYNNFISYDSKIILENYYMEIKLMAKLYDHTKEIKYIDFNSRLNILLSYSLDNFINIYIFPKLKLINTIGISSFKDINDIQSFDEVVLLSYPFPSIICYNKKYIYQLSINGDLIKYKKLDEGDRILLFIDKNLSLAEDRVEVHNFKGDFKYSFNFI